MDPAADLSPPGLAAMIAGFIAALELEDAVLIGNDSGTALTANSSPPTIPTRSAVSC